LPSIPPNRPFFPPGALSREEGALPAPARGKLQGREAQAMSHVPGLPLPAQRGELGSPVHSLKKSLQRSAISSPMLVRQARHGALPTIEQLQGASASAGKAPQAGRLPAVHELVARAGPAHSACLRQQFLGLFCTASPPDPYKDVLDGLEAYHYACRAADVAADKGQGARDALFMLDQLSATVIRYQEGDDANGNRREMIARLQTQITREERALKNVAHALQRGSLPENASLKLTISLTREGVCFEEIAHLVDKGLVRDKPQEARDLLAQEPSSPAAHSPSAGYARILANLKNYADACEARHGAADTPRGNAVTHKAAAWLQALDISIQHYLGRQENLDDARRDPHLQPLLDLRDQLSIERQVLQGVIDELGDNGTLPRRAHLLHALAFAREGVSLHDMARLMGQGLLPSQAAEARMVLDSERARGLVRELDRQTPEARAELTDAYTEGELILLQASGLGLEGGAYYRRLGLPITHQTIAISHTDGQRLGDMSALGAGVCNTVYASRYSGPEGVVSSVFKPLNDFEHGWVAQRIGIDRNRPQIANRNLATQDVARALGFNVVVECRIGCRGKPGGWLDEFQLGLVMARAPGHPASETPPGLFAHPEVRRELTKLQLLDHLVGQGDRHGGNYFIHTWVDESGQTQARVSGIDNDQCFGRNTLDPDDLSHSPERDKKGFRGVQMPLLIDTDMAAAIRAITPERLDALLDDKLDWEEIQATQARLESLLEHINRLEQNQLIITPTEWNEVSDADLKEAHQPDNSYFARDQEYAAARFT
jgi:hypothetical protein